MRSKDWRCCKRGTLAGSRRLRATLFIIAAPVRATQAVIASADSGSLLIPNRNNPLAHECMHALERLAYRKPPSARLRRLRATLAAAPVHCCHRNQNQYRRVPKFSPHGSVFCACAEVTKIITFSSMDPKLRHPAVE